MLYFFHFRFGRGSYILSWTELGMVSKHEFGMIVNRTLLLIGTV